MSSSDIGEAIQYDTIRDDTRRDVLLGEIVRVQRKDDLNGTVRQDLDRLYKSSWMNTKGRGYAGRWDYSRCAHRWTVVCHRSAQAMSLLITMIKRSMVNYCAVLVAHLVRRTPDGAPPGYI